MYRRNQAGVALGLTVGYSFFYTVRLSLSVVKGPMLEAGVLTKEQLGLMGSALFVSYAIGKFVNGVVADYASIRKLMTFGLACSAVLNLLLGVTDAAWLFIGVWCLNGWFQSLGSAPSCVSIYQWFPVRTRGTVYSVWAGSHNIGEGITFVALPWAVAYGGWRGGFVAPALASLVVAAFMAVVLRDRPAVHGLPPPEEALREEGEAPTAPTAPSPSSDPEPVDDAAARAAQVAVLRSPTIWIIALACASMYISRYAINSWAILYLQKARGYDLRAAGAAMVFYPVMGLLGAILSGWMSDRFFRSHRPGPATLYGLCNVSGMALLFWGPGTRTTDAAALSLFGFGIGGLIVFLAGLMAADLVPKKAVGATKGFLGIFAYAGAAFQEVLSGRLIQITEVGGVKVYDFSQAVLFWFGSGVASMLFVLMVWNARPPEAE